MLLSFDLLLLVRSINKQVPIGLKYKGSYGSICKGWSFFDWKFGSFRHQYPKTVQKWVDNEIAVNPKRLNYHLKRLKNQNWSKPNRNRSLPKAHFIAKSLPNKSLLYMEEIRLNFTLFLRFNPIQFLRFSFWVFFSNSSLSFSFVIWSDFICFWVVFGILN